jgi:HEAT repeat protein
VARRRIEGDDYAARLALAIRCAAEMPDTVTGRTELAWEGLRRWETFRSWESFGAPPVCSVSPPLRAALPRLPDIEPRIVSHLLARLSNRSEGLPARQIAAAALEALAPSVIDDSDLHALVSILTDKSDDAWVRRSVIEILSATGPSGARQEVIDSLVSLLGDGTDSGYVRENAARRLAAAGAKQEAVRHAVVGLLRGSQNGWVIGQSARALGAISRFSGRAPTIAILASLLGHEDSHVSFGAVEGLNAAGRVATPDDVIREVLPIFYTKESSDAARVAAAAVLGATGTRVETTNVLPALIARMRDGSDSAGVRVAAAEALGSIGRHESRHERVQAILDAFHRLAHPKHAPPESRLRQTVLFRGLEAMGERAATGPFLAVLAAAVAEDDALRALAAMGPAAATHVVVDALAARLQKRLYGPFVERHRSVHPLAGGVTWTFATERAELVWTLGMLGTSAARPDVVDVLVQALWTRMHDGLESWAAEALGRMANQVTFKRALAPLLEALDDEKAPVAFRPDVVKALAALSTVGSRDRIIDALVACLLRDKRAVALREASAESLADIGAPAATSKSIRAFVACLGEKEPGKNRVARMSWTAASALGRIQSTAGVRVIDGRPYRALDLAARRLHLGQAPINRQRARSPTVHGRPPTIRTPSS